MFAGLKQQVLKTGAALPIPFRRREARPAPKPGRAAKVVPAERGFRRFIRETRAELNKVTWPTREQTIRLTSVVVAVSAAVGLLMGGIDFAFSTLFKLLLGAR